MMIFWSVIYEMKISIIKAKGNDLVITIHKYGEYNLKIVP